MPKPKPRDKQSPARTNLLRRPWVAPAALLLLTALVYARSLVVPVHDWDDYVYLFRDTRLEYPLVGPGGCTYLVLDPPMT